MHDLTLHSCFVDNSEQRSSEPKAETHENKSLRSESVLSVGPMATPGRTTRFSVLPKVSLVALPNALASDPFLVAAWPSSGDYSSLISRDYI